MNEYRITFGNVFSYQKYLLMLLVYFIGISSSTAQTEQRCKYSLFTRSIGMADQNIKDICEDENGFMWLLSDDAVQWFDGSRFHEVAYGTGIHELPGIIFKGLEEVTKKEIWIFYNHGFSVYSTTTHTFIHHLQPFGFSNPLSSYNFFSSGNYFIAENWKGKFYINKQTKIITTTPPKRTTISTDPKAENILSSSFGKKMNNWYGNEINAAFTFIKINEECYLEFDDEKVAVFTNRQEEPVKQIRYPGHSRMIEYRRPNQLIRKNEKTLLLVLKNELWEFDLKELEFKRQYINLQGKPFFENGYFSSAYFDRLGNLWAGSNINGLYKINTCSQPIQLIRQNSNAFNFIKCFLVNDSTNKIIVGTYGSGLLVLDTAGNLIRHFSISTNKNTSENIISTIGKIDNDHYVVFVFRNPVPFLLNTKTLTLTALRAASKSNQFLPDYYSQLMPSGTGFIYPSSSPCKLMVEYNSSTYTVNNMNHADSLEIKQLTDYKIRSADPGFYDRKNYFKRCLANAHAEGLIIIGINKWEKNWLIATLKGLYLFSPDAKLLHVFNKKNGLPNETINAVLIDKNGCAWASHNAGISRLEKNGKVYNLSKQDGLQDDEFNNGAAFITEKGKLYFAGINGINSFYPGEISALDDIPDFKITSIATPEKIFPADTAFWNMKTIKLFYPDNQVRLRFSAVGQNLSGYYNYQYRIGGQKNKWINLRHQEELNLALAPGKYSIEFVVNHEFNSGAKPQKILEIIVVPPYYQRWWFYLAAALLFAGIVWFTFQWLSRRKYNKQLAFLQMQEELETERHRISRDLHDNMGAYTTALLANVEKLKSRHTGDEELDKMKVNAEQILSSLRETIWVLNNKEISLTEFNDSFKHYCLKLLQNFEHINFVSEDQEIDNKILSASAAIHLNKILQEAIQNILKHSGATEIKYQLECNISCSVLIADNGKGFNPETVSKGNGLDNMKWRAAEAGFSLKFVSELDIGTEIIICNI